MISYRTTRAASSSLSTKLSTRVGETCRRGSSRSCRRISLAAHACSCSKGPTSTCKSDVNTGTASSHSGSTRRSLAFAGSGQSISNIASSHMRLTENCTILMIASEALRLPHAALKAVNYCTATVWCYPYCGLCVWMKQGMPIHHPSSLLCKLY